MIYKRYVSTSYTAHYYVKKWKCMCKAYDKIQGNLQRKIHLVQCLINQVYQKFSRI